MPINSKKKILINKAKNIEMFQNIRKYNSNKKYLYKK